MFLPTTSLVIDLKPEPKLPMKRHQRRDIQDGLYGTTFRAKNWRSLNTTGIMCAPFSVLIHIYSLVCIGAIFVPNSTDCALVYIFVYIPLVFLALWSHYMTLTTNPGAVPKGAKPLSYRSYESPKPQDGVVDLEAGCGPTIPQQATTIPPATASAAAKLKDTVPILSYETVPKIENYNIISGSDSAPTKQEETLSGPKEDYIICASCKSYKPPRAHHDSVTGRCIVKFDHFCPWVGNSIGLLNHKFFMQFVFYTFLTCVTSAVIVLMTVRHCKRGQDSWTCNNLSFLPARVLYYSNAFFFFFTMFMLIDQLFIVFGQGKTKIARKKIKAGTAKEEDFGDVTEDFYELFGGNSKKVALHWFIPSELEFPPGMKDKVLGYKWEPSFQANAFQEEREREAASLCVPGESDSFPYTNIPKEGILS